MFAPSPEQSAAAVLRAVNGRVASRVGVVLVLLPGVLLLWLHRRTEPGHGAVQVLQFELGGAGEGLVSSPLQGAAIGARSEEAVQDREKDRAFGSKAKAATGEGVVHGLAAAGEGSTAVQTRVRDPAHGTRHRRGWP